MPRWLFELPPAIGEPSNLDDAIQTRQPSGYCFEQPIGEHECRVGNRHYGLATVTPWGAPASNDAKSEIAFLPVLLSVSLSNVSTIKSICGNAVSATERVGADCSASFFMSAKNAFINAP